MQFPITIGLRRSFLLWLLPFCGLIAALLLASLSPIEPVVRIQMAVAGLLLGAFSLRQNLRLRRLSCLRLSADGAISVGFSDAPEYFVPATLESGAKVHRWLSVVRLTVSGVTYPLVLTPEAIDAEDFRRLRIFLRWRAKFSAPDAA